MRQAVVALVVTLAVASVASAEPKLFTCLEVNTTTYEWNLYGWTSGTYFGWTNDGSSNAGLASYNIKLKGIETGYKMAPSDYKATLPNKGTWGFAYGVDEMIVTAGQSEAFAGQDTATLARCIYNVGNTAGAFSFNPSNTWDCPAMLATGTFAPGQTPSYGDPIYGPIGGWPPYERFSGIAAVFAAQGVVPPVQAYVYGMTRIIPEPATLALLTLGAALIRRRR